MLNTTFLVQCFICIIEITSVPQVMKPYLLKLSPFLPVLHSLFVFLSMAELIIKWCLTKSEKINYSSSSSLVVLNHYINKLIMMQNLIITLNMSFADTYIMHFCFTYHWMLIKRKKMIIIKTMINLTLISTTFIQRHPEALCRLLYIGKEIRNRKLHWDFINISW